MTIIDAYTHNVPARYLKHILGSSDPRVNEAASKTADRCKKSPNMIDLETRITQMDKYGIDKQVTCIYQGIDPNHLPIRDPEEQLKLCRIINDDMANLSDRGNGRVFALGTAPLRALHQGGIEEMRRAVKELGLRGFMTITHVEGKPIDRFDLFWQETNRLGVPVYLHPIDPVNCDGRPYEDEYDLMHVLGWPFETSVAMARLVLSGTMSRNTNLRVIGHHLGAMIPFFSGRINESYDKEMSLVKPEQQFEEVRKNNKPAVHYFQRFYYDTAIGGNKAAIEMTRDIFGAEKIIFGTDYPFGPKDGIHRLSTYPKIVEEGDFSPVEKQLIFEENASKLLSI
jgi:predicted TIM-barrel fold metal-dependent hydrolase